jgi:cytochrome c oxidase cbb3-type subunit III
MTAEERDPVSGHGTTGHEWNGIKELDTPIPRGILMFLIATHIAAVLWWILMPAWPLGSTYTKGLLGADQRKTVEENMRNAAAQRAEWIGQIESLSFADIQANEDLMAVVRESGRQLFGDNCAACHGTDGKGQAGYPNLTDEDWLWGGDPEAIAETMRVGINSMHDEARSAQMPAFGRDQMLDQSEVRNVAAYVYSLSNPGFSTAENIDRIEAGREVFATTCAACHGDDARGLREVGAPNLADDRWIYGGDLEIIVSSIHGGRQGHMPTWDERLSKAEIKTLALYVHSLSVAEP